MKQNNSTEHSAFSKFEIEGKNGSPEPGRPQIGNAEMMNIEILKCLLKLNDFRL